MLITCANHGMIPTLNKVLMKAFTAAGAHTDQHRTSRCQRRLCIVSGSTLNVNPSSSVHSLAELGQMPLCLHLQLV